MDNFKQKCAHVWVTILWIPKLVILTLRSNMKMNAPFKKRYRSQETN